MGIRSASIKVSGAAGGSRSAAKGRHRRKKPWKARSREGYWYGLLKRTVAEDRAERGEPPDLTQAQVLAWADAFFERTGDWPSPWSGPIPEAPGETWLLVAAALALGLRGFPPGSSLPRFLDEHRGRYNCMAPKFTTEQILAWADDWHARTGRLAPCKIGANSRFGRRQLANCVRRDEDGTGYAPGRFSPSRAVGRHAPVGSS